MSWLQYPKIRAVGLLLGVVLGISLLIYDWYVDWTTPNAPELLTLNEAVQRTQGKDWLWVELQDAEQLRWDCYTAVIWQTTGAKLDWMDVVATNSSRSVIMLVTFNDPMPCNEIVASQPVLSGSFKRLNRESYDYENFEGRLDQYPQGSTFVDLNTGYTRPNSSVDMGLVVFTIVCLFGSLQGFYTGFIRKRKPEPTNSERDSSLPPSLDRL